MNAIEHIFTLEDSRPMNVMGKEYIRNQFIFIDSSEIDTFKVFGQSTPFEVAVKLNRSEVLDRVMRCLGSREKKVIKMRFGFYGKEYTLDWIADELDITMEAVRQIQIKAISKLKENDEILCQL